MKRKELEKHFHKLGFDVWQTKPLVASYDQRPYDITVFEREDHWEVNDTGNYKTAKNLDSTQALLEWLEANAPDPDSE